MSIRFISVLREFQISSDPQAPQANTVFLCHAYDPQADAITTFSRRFGDPAEQWLDSQILMDDTLPIGSGEDPRPFYWRGSACISAQTYSHHHGYVNKIYVKEQAKWFLMIPPKNITAGKNWAPFVRGDDLYFVHEYAPFRVLQAAFLSPQDDFMVLNTVAKHRISTPKSADKFSQFRGGANAVEIEGKIVGVGHRNATIGDTIVHRPFIFIYDPDVSVTYYDFNYDFPKDYNIVDPTSLYLKDGVLYLVTSETEQVWDIAPQSGRACLYTIELEGLFNEDSTCVGGRRLYRWANGETSQIRRFLGAWR